MTPTSYVVYVLLIDEEDADDAQYLSESSGDWGPRYTTDGLPRALTFPSASRASAFIREDLGRDWTVKIVAVRVTYERLDSAVPSQAPQKGPSK